MEIHISTQANNTNYGTGAGYGGFFCEENNE